METIKRVLNELYKAVDAQSDPDTTSEVQGYVDYAIELLSDDSTDYGTHMVSEELLEVISNLESGLIEDCIYELEVIISEI